MKDFGSSRIVCNGQTRLYFGTWFFETAMYSEGVKQPGLKETEH